MLGGCRRSPGPLAGRPAADPWDLAARRGGGCRCVPCASGGPGWWAARHLAVAGRLWGRPCPVRPVPDPGGGAPVAASRVERYAALPDDWLCPRHGRVWPGGMPGAGPGGRGGFLLLPPVLDRCQPGSGAGSDLAGGSKAGPGAAGQFAWFFQTRAVFNGPADRRAGSGDGQPCLVELGPADGTPHAGVLCPLAAPAPGGAADRHYHWAKRCIHRPAAAGSEFERYFPPDGSIRPACVCIAVAVCAGPGKKRRLGLGRSAVPGLCLAVRLYSLRRAGRGNGLPARRGNGFAAGPGWRPPCWCCFCGTP